MLIKPVSLTRFCYFVELMGVETRQIYSLKKSAYRLSTVGKKYLEKYRKKSTGTLRKVATKPDNEKSIRS